MKRKLRGPGVGRKGSHGRAKRRAKIFHRPSGVNYEAPNTSQAGGETIAGDDTASDHAGYRLFHLETLFRTLQENLCCKTCGGVIAVSEISLRGLGGTYAITCENCAQPNTFRSDPMIDDTPSAFEINRRAILAMRCIGQGYEGLETFCGVMDLPPAIERPTYNSIVQRMAAATTEVAKTVFQEAVEEEVKVSGEQETRNITVQCNETWQKRGYKSINGVCTVIGSATGKVVDLEVLSFHCDACMRWKGKQAGAEWASWYKAHKPHCQANHTGSLGAIQVDGTVKMFQRPVEKHNVQQNGHIGDKDTESSTTVAKTEPYEPDVNVNRIECYEDVEKRFGTEMRELKLRLKGQILSDGRPLGGKGRLTDTVIDQMQTYYRNAIRNNSQSVENMVEAIWAIWHHECSTDVKPEHHLCPRGENSWCRYNKAVAAGTVRQFKHKNSLPQAVMEAIKPVFEISTAPELLAHCVGGKTQNASESLDNVIWKFCPKKVYTGRNIVCIAANLAAITFSKGATGILDVMTELGVTPGSNAKAHMNRTDQIRLEQAQQHVAESTRKARVAIRRLKVAQNETAAARDES